jgi:CubicO group peptidase (beta-lactamase class C family)
LDTQITPFEIAPGNIFRIKKLCSILLLSNPHFITFVVAVIDQEHGIDHAFTFQVKGDTIARQTFVNEIAPSGGRPIPRQNAHFTPYISSRLLYLNFPAHFGNSRGISLHEVEFFDGQTSYITHDGKELPGGSGNSLNVSSGNIRTGAIIHVGGRLFYVRVNGTRLEILDNIVVDPIVDFNERSSAVIPTTNMGDIFSLLTEKSLISYKIDDSDNIIKLKSVSFQNIAVSADQYSADHVITSTRPSGGTLRLALWRVYKAGLYIKVEETPAQESGIEQVRITNLLNPLYLVGIKNRERELRLITWGVTITPTPLPHSGEAWPQLESRVNALVKDFFRYHPVPGMTVAVSIGRRLILSKGYGWARYLERPMERDMHVKIGSTTKALVTGPAGWQLMKSKGIDSDTQTLYGPNGLFGNDFDEDIQIGIEEYANDENYDSSKWKEWYEKITIQNLLDRRSGLSHSGDEVGAARMFHPKTVEEEGLEAALAKVTYKEAHKHFLRTKPLKCEPGTTPCLSKNGEVLDPYSNQAFGLWTLLMPKMSGKSYDDKFYKEYTREDYLKRIRLGLHGSFHAWSKTPDSRDAVGYRIDDSGNLVSLAFEDSRLGLAAGGFMASAQDMIRVMRYLKREYTWEEIDKMGWSGGSTMLSHGGLTGGGTAYVVMFRQSDICVALNTNIGTSGSLAGLARNIALEVPARNVPFNFDLFAEEEG